MWLPHWTVQVEVLTIRPSRSVLRPSHSSRCYRRFTHKTILLASCLPAAPTVISWGYFLKTKWFKKKHLFTLFVWHSGKSQGSARFCFLEEASTQPALRVQRAMMGHNKIQGRGLWWGKNCIRLSPKWLCDSCCPKFMIWTMTVMN